MRVVPREPWRGGQVCGQQIHYGTVALPLGTWSSFCGELKADGVPLCPVHRDEQLEEYGEIPKFAPGNAVGCSTAAPFLYWEGSDGERVSPDLKDVEDWRTAKYTITDDREI
jgi:hypothetical protein